MLCPCGHTFCRACISLEIAANGKCPFDGTPLETNALFPNKIIAEEVRAYLRNGGAFTPAPKPVHCSFESYGCEWKGPAEALATHLVNCDYEKMKDFILRKEREAAQLREEVKSKDEQIAQLRSLMSDKSMLHADLQRLLRLALSLASQGKTAIERGVGQLVNNVTEGWARVTDDKTYKDLSVSVELTAQRCVASLRNVITTLNAASKYIGDSELLAKLLAQTAQWKVKLAHTLEEIRDTFARISVVPANESEDDAALRAATRESLRSYLDEVQRMNEAHEHEQTELVEGVIASLPPPPATLPPPLPTESASDASASASATPSASGSATTVDSVEGKDEDLDGFVDIVSRRPLPPLPSAQLRK